LALLCFCVGPSNAQEKIASLDEIKNQSDLDKTITALDTKLFDAYNRCNLKTFAIACWRMMSSFTTTRAA